MYLVTKWFGVFLFDKSKIVDKILFSKKINDIIKRLEKIKNDQVLPEEKKLLTNKKIIVNEKRLAQLGDYKPDDIFFIKTNIEAIDYDFSEEILNKALLKISKKDIEKILESEDLQIIQMINTLDELIQTSNLLSERIECWNNIKYSDTKIKPLENVYLKINDEIKNLEDLIELEIEKIAPNTSKLIGSLISARLISLAGGIEKLAMLPASTIQILGAEKALFRYKKEGGRPPKHGIIFQHNLINKASRNNRGKIARMLSSKISIAVKADVFTKNDIAESLKSEIDERLKEIRNQ